jgi:acyl carrier protein
MDAITQTVKDYVLSTFLPGEDPRELTPTTPLVSSGILDSLATLELVSFLEEKYGIELQAHDVDASRLETLDAITRLVRSKTEAPR